MANLRYLEITFNMLLNLNLNTNCKTTYSNTALSFWSPQMSISEIERKASTSASRFCSVTWGFFVRNVYRYLQKWIATFIKLGFALSNLTLVSTLSLRKQYRLQVFQRVKIFWFPRLTTKPRFLFWKHNT